MRSILNVCDLFLRVAALIITVTYLSLLYGLHVPDWEYQISTGSYSAPKTFSVSFDQFFLNFAPDFPGKKKFKVCDMTFSILSVI